MAVHGRKFSIANNCIINVVPSASVGSSAFSMVVDYINKSERDVEVKTRLGMDVHLPAAQAGKSVEIHVQWTMSDEYFNRTLVKLQKRELSRQSMLGNVITAIWDRHGRTHLRRAKAYSATLVVRVTIDQIAQAGNALYLEELDVLLTMGDGKADLEHPFSPNERMKASLAESIPTLTQQTFIMSIKAVDNSRLKNRQDRYLMIGDKVHHIPIERDSTMLDGIHVTTRPCAHDVAAGGDVDRIVTEHMSFDEADLRFRFQSTIEAALQGGDATAAIKADMAERVHAMNMEIAQAKYRQAQLDAETEAQKHQLKVEQMERERIVAEDKHQREMEKAANDKAAYERDRNMGDAKHRRELEKMGAEQKISYTKGFITWVSAVREIATTTMGMMAFFGRLASS